MVIIRDVVTLASLMILHNDMDSGNGNGDNNNNNNSIIIIINSDNARGR
jgi:hypothetical protein